MKKLLVLLFATQIMFGIDKQLVGSIGAGTILTSVALWVANSVFPGEENLSDLKELKTKVESYDGGAKDKKWEEQTGSDYWDKKLESLYQNAIKLGVTKKNDNSQYQFCFNFHKNKELIIESIDIKIRKSQKENSFTQSTSRISGILALFCFVYAGYRYRKVRIDEVRGKKSFFGIKF